LEKYLKEIEGTTERCFLSWIVSLGKILTIDSLLGRYYCVRLVLYV